MPEDVYSFAECVFENSSERLFPMGVVMAIALTLSDIDEQSYKNAKFILQVIDVITNEAFADEVRFGCKEVFGWEVTRRVKNTDGEMLAEYYCPSIVAAVDWWTGQIQLGDMSGFGNIMPSLYKQFSVDEIYRFRWRLTNLIDGALFHYGCVSLGVDYLPDSFLKEAGMEAGIDQDLALFIFPPKTKMYVYPDSVEVFIGNSKNSITIYRRL